MSEQFPHDNSVTSDISSSSVKEYNANDVAAPANAGPSAAQDASRLFVFTTNKAGMGTVDRNVVNQVVYDMSKNSAYFKNAQRKADTVSKKIDKMKARYGVAPDSMLPYILTHRVCATI